MDPVVTQEELYLVITLLLLLLAREGRESKSNKNIFNPFFPSFFFLGGGEPNVIFLQPRLIINTYTFPTQIKFPCFK